MVEEVAAAAADVGSASQYSGPDRNTYLALYIPQGDTMATRYWAYMPSDEGKLDVDRAFYDRVPASVSSSELADEFEIPIRSGRAWPVKAGQICRVIARYGPRVADFNAWSLTNPRERVWAARTRQLESTHVTTYNRLWSTLPYLRPMLTIAIRSPTGSTRTAGAVTISLARGAIHM